MWGGRGRGRGRGWRSCGNYHPWWVWGAVSSTRKPWWRGGWRSEGSHENPSGGRSETKTGKLRCTRGFRMKRSRGGLAERPLGSYEECRMSCVLHLHKVRAGTEIVGAAWSEISPDSKRDKSFIRIPCKLSYQGVSGGHGLSRRAKRGRRRGRKTM